MCQGLRHAPAARPAARPRPHRPNPHPTLTPAAELLFGVILAVIISNYVAHHLHPDGPPRFCASTCSYQPLVEPLAEGLDLHSLAVISPGVLLALRRAVLRCAGLYEAELDDADAGQVVYLRQVGGSFLCAQHSDRTAALPPGTASHAHSPPAPITTSPPVPLGRSRRMRCAIRALKTSWHPPQWGSGG